jgi:L-lactate utilization protein LutC
MKPIAIIMLLAAFSAQANDKTDKECEAAVDAAGSMNVNQKDCDYSKEGLNGFLQKAFKKGDDGAVLETGDPAEKPLRNASALQANKASAKPAKEFSLNVEVDQWANIPLARAQLLPKAMEKCGQGFAITGEHYRSLAMGRIELGLQFICD